MNDGAALDLELPPQAFELGLCLLRIGADVTVLEAREDLAGAHALALLDLDPRHDTREARADLGELAADHRVARHHVVGLVVNPQRDGRCDQHEYRARYHPGDMAAARRRLLGAQPLKPRYRYGDEFARPKIRAPRAQRLARRVSRGHRPAPARGPAPMRARCQSRRAGKRRTAPRTPAARARRARRTS